MENIEVALYKSIVNIFLKGMECPLATNRYYENHRTVEWCQIYAPRPGPLLLINTVKLQRIQDCVQSPDTVQQMWEMIAAQMDLTKKNNHRIVEKGGFVSLLMESFFFDCW